MGTIAGCGKRRLGASFAGHFPYPVVLVLLGLLAYWIPGVHPPVLTPNLVLLGFLPPLLFEAAWNLRLPILRDVWAPVLWLVLPGVAIAIGAIGAVAHKFLGFGWSEALLLGAILSPTDPTAVVAVFRRLPVPRHLETLIEAESLFNDGTGIVAFKVLLGCAAGASLPGYHAIGTLLWLALGGLACGLAIGLPAGWLAARLTNRFLDVALTIVVAYGGFAMAQELGASGVLSVVAAGLAMGTLTRGRRSREPEAAFVDVFWRYTGLVANGLLFLLVGVTLAPSKITSNLASVGWVIAAMLLARAIALGIIFPVSHFVRMSAPVASAVRVTHPRNWPILLGSGLRGALSLTLALSLPVEWASRIQFVTVVSGCVLFTLVVQGLAAPWLVRWFAASQEASTRRN